MAGRAGRPQFCDTATVVIMTEARNKEKYEHLIVGSTVVESSLDKHLVEHFNAEIILGTINSLDQAVEWLKSTYLYIRMKKNPEHYELLTSNEFDSLDEELLNICHRAFDSMLNIGLIVDTGDGKVGGTGLGRLMSRYYLASATMELLTSNMESLSMGELLEIICQSRELSDVVLRTNERVTLNKLNRNREKKTVKYQLPGKIKTKEMKANILLQASLGCMSVSDVGLSMETPRLMRLASRIATCLVEVVLTDTDKSQNLTLVKNSVLLAKSFNCGIWSDSEFVSKQMEKVGIVLSSSLVSGGYKDIESIANANPRMLELAAKKVPPFGNNMRDWAGQLPQYQLSVVLDNVTMTCVSTRISVSRVNRDKTPRDQVPGQHRWVLVIGAGNSVISVTRGTDALLMSEDFTKHINIKRQGWEEDQLEVSILSVSVAGVDKTVNVTIDKPVDTTQRPKQTLDHKSFLSQFRRECRHSCEDKLLCRHDCCKVPSYSGDKRGNTTPSGDKRVNTVNTAPRAKKPGQQVIDNIKKMKFTFKRPPDVHKNV